MTTLVFLTLNGLKPTFFHTLSVAEFRRLRELRNELAHDYPDDPDEAVAALALVVAAVPSLLAIEAALRVHIEGLLARGAAEL